jgi:hypothetical protein
VNTIVPGGSPVTLASAAAITGPPRRQPSAVSSQVIGC